MEVLENFKNLCFDVWNKGISVVNISEIVIALLIFLFFLFLRGIFSKFVIKRLENYVSKTTNNFDNSLVFSMEGPAKFFPIVLGFFGINVPHLHEATPLGIGISVAIIIIAALNLILDFDLIETGANQGAPKYMEWFGAFALIVTLIWLYIEILRLLAMLASRRD